VKLTCKTGLLCESVGQVHEMTDLVKNNSVNRNQSETLVTACVSGEKLNYTSVTSVCLDGL
jgi:hypothetical protein